MIVTGPNWDIFKGTSFKFIYASPVGNTMMTGPMGLVKAAQYRFGQIADSKQNLLAAGRDRKI